MEEVLTRLSQQYPTIKKLLLEFQKYNGRAYKTYAEMDADKANLSSKTKVTVTNDATSSNNGDWQWDGVAFTKSAYDAVEQAKSYADAQDSTNLTTAKSYTDAVAAVDTTTDLFNLKGSASNVVARVDEKGELYLANMQNKSVQQAIEDLQSVDATIEEIPKDSAPSLQKLTDAENSIFELTEEKYADVYLSQLNNTSLQDYLQNMNDKIDLQFKAGAIFDSYKDFGIDQKHIAPTVTALKIQAAINYVSALPFGGTIVFRTGSYVINKAIRPENNVTIKFMKGAKLVPMGAVAAFTRDPVDGDIANYLTDAAFIDIEIDGSEQSHTSYNSSIKGYYIGGFNRCLWLRNYVHDVAATGIGIDFAKDSFILNNTTENCGRLASVGNPGASGIGVGTGILQNESLIITNNICRDNKNFGIFVEWQRKDYSLVRSRNTVITGNICTGNNHGLGDCGVEGLIAVGNQLNDNVSDGILLDTGTLPVSNNRPQAGSGGLIANNQILRNGGHGVMYNCGNVDVDGHYTWSDNNIESNVKSGIYITARSTTLDDIAIVGGSINDNGSAAITIADGTINNLDIDSVRMHRNGSTASIRLNGTVNTGAITNCKIRPNADIQAMNGSGLLKNLWINGNQYVGTAATPVGFNNSSNTVTYGTNSGLGV